MTDGRPATLDRPLPAAALSTASALGGLVAAAGGLCWIVKGGVILATGVQPPLLFEVAPLLMALAALALTRHLPSSRDRTRTSLVALAACASAALVVVDEALRLPPAVTGSAMAAGTLLTLAVLVVAGLRLRRRIDGFAGSLPLVLGVGTIPSVLVGGGLTMVWGERALELPLVVLGLLWTAFGVHLARSRYVIDASREWNRHSA